VFSVRFDLNINIQCRLILVFKAVPWLRQFVAGLIRRRPRFDPGPVSVSFVVDKVALGQVFLVSVSFHHCSILIFIYVLLLPEGQTSEAWGPSKSSAHSEIAAHWIDNYFCLVLIGLNILGVNVKVRLFLCLIKHSAMKHMGEWRCSTTFNLGTNWKLVVRFMPRPQHPW
jgi:hypothetical protein